MAENLFDIIKTDKDGLVPAVIVDHETKEVLMVGYMNQEALRLTLEKGTTVFWSRSRRKLWAKGETSGHVQKVRRVLVDYDADTLLFEVEQVGAACHEGYRSCFYREVGRDGTLTVIAKRVFDPKKVYGQ